MNVQDIYKLDEMTRNRLFAAYLFAISTVMRRNGLELQTVIDTIWDDDVSKELLKDGIIQDHEAAAILAWGYFHFRDIKV